MINPPPPPPRMTWKGKLLRLLHITSSKTTVDHPLIPDHLKHHDHPSIPHLKHHDHPLIPDHLKHQDHPSIPHLPVVVKPPPETDSDDDPPSDYLPRDIILDILSRLPAECIFKWQRVSRPFQILTTTPFFTRMQLQRSSPVIVVQLSSEASLPNSIKLYYMNKEFETIEEKLTGSSSLGSSLYKPPVTTFRDPTLLLGSYHGFLTFANLIDLPATFYMWNPITGEQFSVLDKNMHVCGLYYNQVGKDHELLCYTTDKTAPYGQYCRFSAYNLRSKQRRDVGSFAYTPSSYRPPVIIKGMLYWMIDRRHYFRSNREVRPPFSHSIMSFNIETGEFNTLEPGGRKYSTTEDDGDFSEGMMSIHQLHLSEIDGELCLCDFVRFNQLVLSIFNHATQCWSTRTNVVIPKYCGLIFDWPNRFASEVVLIKDNELLVRQGRRLVRYNMVSHDCKMSEIMGCVDKGIRVTVHTHGITSFHL